MVEQRLGKERSRTPMQVGGETVLRKLVFLDSRSPDHKESHGKYCIPPRNAWVGLGYVPSEGVSVFSVWERDETDMLPKIPRGGAVVETADY